MKILILTDDTKKIAFYSEKLKEHEVDFAKNRETAGHIIWELEFTWRPKWFDKIIASESDIQLLKKHFLNVYYPDKHPQGKAVEWEVIE